MRVNYYNPLFDPPPTPKEATDEAVERVRENADNAWMARATAAVEEAGAKSHSGTFTTDDVWDILGEDKPHEPRAMGAVMRSLAKQGVIQSEAAYTTSRRPECHRRPIRLWAWIGR